MTTSILAGLDLRFMFEKEDIEATCHLELDQTQISLQCDNLSQLHLKEVCIIFIFKLLSIMISSSEVVLVISGPVKSSTGILKEALVGIVIPYKKNITLEDLHRLPVSKLSIVRHASNLSSSI